MDETSRFSQIEIDDDVPAPIPQPATVERTRCRRCSVASPLNEAGRCPVCELLMQPREVTSSTTPQQVPMSPRMARVYGFLQGRGINLTPFSTDQMVLGFLPRLNAVLAEVTKAPMEPGRRDMIVDLETIMRRVPAARVGAVVQVETQAPARVQAKDLIGVADEASSSGIMTYWSLPGSVDITQFKAAWEVEGLDVDLLPSVPSAKVALHRACKDQASKTRLLRAHPQGGWVLVDERRAGDTLAYEVGIRIRLAEDGEQILITPAKGSDGTEAQMIGAAVRAEFNKLRSEYASVDISIWLVHRVGVLNGVALRNSGGFYFVPKEYAETLGKISRAISAASAHTVYEIPVMQGSKTVAAVIDALRREVQEVIADHEGVLNAGEIGARAARTRVDQVTELGEKIKGYEQLLGVKLGEVVEKLNALRAKMGAVTTRASQLEIDND